MEIDNLVSAFERTLSLLQASKSSDWAGLSVEEVTLLIEQELEKARNSQPLELKRFRYLFAPTGSLQEISIDNGWGNEFIELANVIDRFTGV